MTFTNKNKTTQANKNGTRTSLINRNALPVVFFPLRVDKKVKSLYEKREDERMNKLLIF